MAETTNKRRTIRRKYTSRPMWRQHDDNEQCPLCGQPIETLEQADIRDGHHDVYIDGERCRNCGWENRFAQHREG